MMADLKKVEFRLDVVLKSFCSGAGAHQIQNCRARKCRMFAHIDEQMRRSNRIVKRTMVAGTRFRAKFLGIGGNAFRELETFDECAQIMLSFVREPLFGDFAGVDPRSPSIGLRA